MPSKIPERGDYKMDGDSNYTQTASIRASLVDSDEFDDGMSKKKFYGVSSISDIYDYMKGVLAPFLLGDCREIEGAKRCFVQRAHVLMGGVRMRQIRLKPLECTEMERDRECYDETEMDREEVVFYGANSTANSTETVYAYRYEDSSVLLDQPFTGKFSSYPGGGYVQDLPLDLAETVDIMESLEEMRWMDGATLFVSVDFTTYNPSQSLHTVVRLVWEMPTSGIFSNDDFKTWRFDRFYPETPGLLLMAAYVSIACFVAMWTAMMMADVWSHCKKASPTPFWTGWRRLDLLNLLIFYVSMALFAHNEFHQKALIQIFDASPPFQSFRRLQVCWV